MHQMLSGCLLTHCILVGCRTLPLVRVIEGGFSGGWCGKGKGLSEDLTDIMDGCLIDICYVELFGAVRSATNVVFGAKV